MKRDHIINFLAIYNQLILPKSEPRHGTSVHGEDPPVDRDVDSFN